MGYQEVGVMVVVNLEVLLGMNLDPENPVWREAAHEILLDISEKALVLHSSACVRKGCQQRVSSWSKVGCDKCKRVQYCSDGCLKR